MELQRFLNLVDQTIVAKELDRSNVSRRIGKSPTYVRDLIEGRSKKPQIDGLIDLAIELGLDPTESIGIPRLPLQVVGRVGGGEVVFSEDAYAKGGGQEEIEAPPGLVGVAVAVRVEGASMSPAYRPGDILVYRREEPDDWRRYVGRDVVAKLTDGRTYVKTLKKAGKTTATLSSINEEDIINAKIDWAAPVLWVRRT